MMPHDEADYLGGNALVVDEPGMPWVLRIPEGWSVDTSGANDGALVARADQAENVTGSMIFPFGLLLPGLIP